MILTILTVLILITIVILLIVAKKYDNNILMVVSIFLSLFAGAFLGEVINTAIHFDTKEYDMLIREIEYGQVYSSDVERRIYSWDEELTKYNNYWFRFETKDREPYYIDVNIYLEKFNIKN